MEINCQLIIERLTQRMNLDCAYLIKYPFLQQEYDHLLLAIKPVSGLSLKVLKPLVELCLMDQPAISFELIFTPVLKNNLKTGSLFYCYATLREHRIFGAQGEELLCKQKTMRGILDLTEAYYKKAVTVSADFLRGADTFAVTANYLRALFMVHQSLESHLRMMQVMVHGKCTNVHNLDSRIRSLDAHFCRFKHLFMGTTDEEKERFRLLDRAFVAVGQNRDLELSAFDASQLYDHCVSLQAAMEKLFHYFIDQVRAAYDKLVLATATSKRAAENTAIIKHVQQEKQVVLTSEPMFHAFPWPEAYQSDIYRLLLQIRQDHLPEQIMLLNYYVSHPNGRGLFDFPQKESGRAEIYLVLIKKRVGSCHYQQVVFGQVTAIVSFISTNFIEAKLKKGSRFSHTIWNESVVLYRDPNYKPTYTINAVNWPDTLAKIEQVWTRNSTLIHGLVGIFSSENYCSPQLAVLLLNQLTVIGLHSYIYLRIGYAPMNAKTEELVEWTNICDRKVKAFFEPKGPLEEILNSEILKPMKGRIYELPPALHQADRAYFIRRANELAEFFMDLCASSMAYMEMKSRGKANE